MIVPVYLNQAYVFDLLAMAKGGLATVTSVVESSSNSGRSSGEISGTFGLNNAISALLRIDMSGKLSKSTDNTDHEERSEDRVHTPASLLYQLIAELKAKETIKHKINTAELDAGDIVEFQCELRRNPFNEALETLIKVGRLADTFATKSTSSGKKPNSGKPKEPDIFSQMQTLLDDFNTGNTRDLIGSLTDQDTKALITVQEEFLSDPTLSNLLDGTFSVLGKVINIAEDSSKELSLIRRSVLGRTPVVLKEFVGAFSALSTSDELTFNSMNPELPGPAIHILPIAIYA